MAENAGASSHAETNAPTPIAAQSNGETSRGSDPKRRTTTSCGGRVRHGRRTRSATRRSAMVRRSSCACCRTARSPRRRTHRAASTTTSAATHRDLVDRVRRRSTRVSSRRNVITIHARPLPRDARTTSSASSGASFTRISEEVGRERRIEDRGSPARAHRHAGARERAAPPRIEDRRAVARLRRGHRRRGPVPADRRRRNVAGAPNIRSKSLLARGRRRAPTTARVPGVRRAGPTDTATRHPCAAATAILMRVRGRHPPLRRRPGEDSFGSGAPTLRPLRGRRRAHP